MEVRVAGGNARLVEVDGVEAALDLAAWARRAGICAEEIVPAARTVLFDGLEEPDALSSSLSEWRPQATPLAGKLITIDMEYDGADLRHVAEQWGTDEAGVVALHQELEFTAAFCGFAPGFAYLAGLPDTLAVGRRDTPRTRVPAGSVAVADTWCAVYPTASPGGWRLLAHRRSTLGSRPGRTGHAPSRHPSAFPSAMSLRVTAASGLITVQDRGRVGYAHLGVPRAGALDRPAAALANRLVGNGVDAAVLEVTFGSLALRSDVGRWVAVTGARCEVHVEGAIRSHGQAVWIPAEGQLQIGSPQEGMRVYVAVGGGVAVEPVLGSRATDTLAWVGPPRVDVGRVLPVGKAVGAPVEHETPRPPLRGPLRVRPGPRADWFPAGAWEELVRSAYVVTPESNRIGLRLAGSQLSRSRAGELLSEGIVLGSIQVPPDGQPVLFLADHPTTGGYPVIGVVEADDLWQCAQVRPGESLLFTVA